MKSLTDLEKVCKSMSKDILYIHEQLATYEKMCVKHNLPLGKEWKDIKKSLRHILLEMASFL